MISELPQSLTVNGVEYPINADFRDAFDAIAACNADDLSPMNKQLALLEIIYGEIIPPETNEAARLAKWFLDGGEAAKRDTPPPKTMDYEQDAPLLFSAVNKVAGREVRDPNTFCHWWTFLGYCNEISPESPIAHIVSIRYKMATGKKLEKHEQEYYGENQHLVDMKSGANFDNIIRQLRGE